MARYQNSDYPMGSVSEGTMRPEDLIPAFTSELEYRLRHASMPRKQRAEHSKLLREIEKRMTPCEETEDGDNYYESEDADYDLEALFDALECYAGPYFYFGVHPGDGADYGYWLSENWDQDFVCGNLLDKADMTCSVKVNDLSEVPAWFRGEVALVNDHGNVNLYVKTSRALRLIWSIV